jgi:hypothetical protein
LHTFYGPQDPGAGNEGIGTFISTKLAHLVHSSGNVGNLAQWVVLRGYPGGDVAVLNIYTPNSTPARILLWEELVNSLPMNC